MSIFAQWREITESFPEPRCDAQTVAKLVEIPGEIIEGLRANIEAERDQPTRAEIAKRVAAVRESRQFDETDSNMLGLFEPNFSDREHRTPERTRKLAEKAFRDLRPIEGNKPLKGNKRYHPRPEGIGSTPVGSTHQSGPFGYRWAGVVPVTDDLLISSKRSRTGSASPVAN